MKALTADHVACAIVAAARHCGEDPIAFLQGATNERTACRRYGLEVLRTEFPDWPLAALARSLGVPRGGATNYPHRPLPRSFSADGLRSVLAAYRALVAGLPPSAPVRDRSPAPVPAASSPHPMQSTIRHFGETVRVGANHGKRDIWDNLREAVANTPGARPIDTA